MTQLLVTKLILFTSILLCGSTAFADKLIIKETKEPTIAKVSNTKMYGECGTDKIVVEIVRIQGHEIRSSIAITRNDSKKTIDPSFLNGLLVENGISFSSLLCEADRVSLQSFGIMVNGRQSKLTYIGQRASLLSDGNMIIEKPVYYNYDEFKSLVK